MTDHVDPADADSARAFASERTRNQPAGAGVMRSVMRIRTSDDDPDEEAGDPALFEVLIDEPGLLPTLRVRFRDMGETWHELEKTGGDLGLVWFVGAALYGAFGSSDEREDGEVEDGYEEEPER